MIDVSDVCEYLTVTAANLESMGQPGPSRDAAACREAVERIDSLERDLAEAKRISDAMHEELHGHDERREWAEQALAERTAYAEGLEEALQRIATWADAYPLSVFPEPDLERAAAVLKAAGMTLDAISASAMRHVITQVGDIARKALATPVGGLLP